MDALVINKKKKIHYNFLMKTLPIQNTVFYMKRGYISAVKVQVTRIINQQGGS